MTERDYPRFSGGAGSRTHPLSDEDYRRQMKKLTALAAADSRQLEEDNE